MKPSTGDKITALRYRDGFVCSATVTDDIDSDVFRWMMPWPYTSPILEVVSIHEEGVMWIYGWHKPDSKEIAALKVAFALGKTTSLSQEMTSESMFK